MAIATGIFKAYDVRGKVGSELNEESVELIGQAFGHWLPEYGSVAVGRDMRPDSAALAAALIRGLQLQGRDVIDIGEVTSDMIYFAVGHLKLAGGAMVTASHNPGEYNGIKFCREEAKPVGEESGLYDIRDAAIAGSLVPAAQPGRVEQKEVAEEWISHVLSFIDVTSLKPFKIAVDAGNGMGGKIFPELEPFVPWEVKELFFELDGTFPNHIANPLEPKNLIDIQAELAKGDYVAGVAFDGDGDRAVLLDENGDVLSGTVLTALLAQFFLYTNPNATVLLNAICGKAALDAIVAAGGTPVRTRVGHSFIKADMRKYKAVFAGEHSGHYYFKDNYMADSGLIAAVIGLYLLTVSGKSLSELAQPFREAYVQIPETNFEVTDKEAVIKSVSEAFVEAQQEHLDGLTVYFEGGWFNVRPSNTEALLRMNAEAKDTVQLELITNKVSQIIQQ